MQLARSLARYILSSDPASCIGIQEVFLKNLDPSADLSLQAAERKEIFILLLESIANEDTTKVTFPDLERQKLTVPEWMMIFSSQKAAILQSVPGLFKQSELAATAALEINLIYDQIFLQLLRSYDLAFKVERQLIRNAPDAVIVIDAESSITLWNPKAEEIFGWTAEEVMGKPLSDTIVPPAYRAAHAAGMKRYLTTREAHVLNQSIEITALNKSGREFMISLTISHIEQADKDVFVAFLRNIEDQKINERELQKKKIELVQSNQELEQYAWLTSHDLREPLRKILTYSDLILSHETNVPAQVREKLEKISASANRMGKLIRAMLTYSSISDESQLYQITPLQEILTEVLADLELSVQQSGATVITDDLPVIEAIPHQMRQLFQNLISNAIKYSKTDVAPRIHISSHPVDANHVSIILSDNGIGFDAKDEEKIFLLFHRLNTMEKKQDTGIGLALCKKIVLNHGGTISVSSEPGEGSRFTITFPYKHVY